MHTVEQNVFLPDCKSSQADWQMFIRTIILDANKSEIAETYPHSVSCITPEEYVKEMNNGIAKAPVKFNNVSPLERVGHFSWIER